MFGLFKKKETIYVTRSITTRAGKNNHEQYSLIIDDDELLDYINKIIIDIVNEVPEFGHRDVEFGVPEPFGIDDVYTDYPLMSSCIEVVPLGTQYHFYSFGIWRIFHAFNILGRLEKEGYRIKYYEAKPIKSIIGVDVVYNSYLSGKISKETFLETYHTLSGIDVSEDMKKFINVTKFTPEQIKCMERIKNELEMFKALQIGKEDPTAKRMLEMSKEILNR